MPTLEDLANTIGSAIEDLDKAKGLADIEDLLNEA